MPNAWLGQTGSWGPSAEQEGVSGGSDAVLGEVRWGRVQLGAVGLGGACSCSELREVQVDTINP